MYSKLEPKKNLKVLSFLSDSLLFFSKKKASRRERESQKLNFVMVSDSFFLKEKDKSLFLFVCPLQRASVVSIAEKPGWGRPREGGKGAVGTGGVTSVVPARTDWQAKEAEKTTNCNHLTEARNKTGGWDALHCGASKAGTDGAGDGEGAEG